MRYREKFKDILIELEAFWGIEDIFCNKNLKRVDKEINGDDRSILLRRLYEIAVNCKECALHRSRRNLVFGEGSPYAELMFVGEAPGRDEDLQGRPFVGKAGQLLTRLINKMGFDRTEVYIANVLKCRPPQNRNPLPSEILACKHFLFKQIEIIQPKVICTLGKFSTSLLVNSNAGISALRGKVFDFNGIKVVPTFHPAYLLRNPKDKILVWQDALKILKLLGRTPASEKD